MDYWLFNSNLNKKDKINRSAKIDFESCIHFVSVPQIRIRKVWLWMSKKYEMSYCYYCFRIVWPIAEASMCNFYAFNDANTLLRAYLMGKTNNNQYRNRGYQHRANLRRTRRSLPDIRVTSRRRVAPSSANSGMEFLRAIPALTHVCNFYNMKQSFT